MTLRFGCDVTVILVKIRDTGPGSVTGTLGERI